MTIFSNFNINIGFNFGMNNWFSPINSCFGGFSGFNFGSFFSNPFMTPTMPMLNITNIWNSSNCNVFNFNNYNFNSASIFSGINCNSYWDNSSFWSNKTAITSTNKSNSNKSSKINNSAVKNISWWKEQGYNETKGKELAANTKKHSDALRKAGVKGQCGRGVRLGINDTYYNGNMHYERFGQARLTGDNFLSKDSHFKKINVQGMNLSKGDIPAGAIVIYDAGYSNGNNRHCGHIEVSDGNGHGYSDFTSTLLQNYGRRREPKEIWIPV